MNTRSLVSARGMAFAAAAFGVGFLVAAPAAARVMLMVNGLKTSREYPSMKECEAVREKILARRSSVQRDRDSEDAQRGRDRGDDFNAKCRPRVY